LGFGFSGFKGGSYLGLLGGATRRLSSKPPSSLLGFGPGLMALKFSIILCFFKDKSIACNIKALHFQSIVALPYKMNYVIYNPKKSLCSALWQLDIG
jgi:hypothetical protein